RGTEMLRSQQTFVGGVSHRGEHGAFVMRLEGEELHGSDLRGSKTYFFFGNKIVALGSGIASSDRENPVQTNLFQKHLSSSDRPIFVNDSAVSSFPLESSLS